MCCFVSLLLSNEMQISVRRFSAIPHLRDQAVVNCVQYIMHSHRALLQRATIIENTRIRQVRSENRHLQQL